MSPAVSITPLAGIEGHLEPGSWPWAEANRPAIDAHWRRLVAERPALFNGQVLVCTRRQIVGEVFRASYRVVDYASFIAWRDFGWPDREVANCFAMAALRGSDGAFVLGEMSAATANPGKIYFAAGTPDLDDVLPDGRVDLAGSVIRELAEETGLDANDMAMSDRWTLVDEYPRLALMRELRATVPAAELKRRIELWLADQVAPELAAVHIVRHINDISGDRMPPFMAPYLAHMLDDAQAG